MLVISRRKGEKIVIGGNIVVTILDGAKRADQIRLGFEAPKDVQIDRLEVSLQKSAARGRGAGDPGPSPTPGG